MAHTIQNKEKLLNRVRRIKGQVEAVERALEQEQECDLILHTLSACHGALNSLTGEVLEGHIRFHVLDPNKKQNLQQAQDTELLIELVKRYIK